RRTACLRITWSSRHPAAHDLSRPPAQSQPGFRKGTDMSIAAIRREEVAPEAVRWTLPHARSLRAVNELVTAPLLERGMWSWRAWWIALAGSSVGPVG